MAGWPSDADLADRLGLAAGDDADRVAAANAAAIADAVAVWPARLDPVAGPDDAGQFEAVLLLGQWWYENRNRPEGLDSLNPVAAPTTGGWRSGSCSAGRLPVA